MKLEELKSIILNPASNVMKKYGEEAFNKGWVTYFKGKRIHNIYHIYGRVKEDTELKEFNTHIKINLQKKKLEGASCSCDNFKELSSSGYTFMCNHITATAYRFFSLLSKERKEEKEIISKDEPLLNEAQYHKTLEGKTRKQSGIKETFIKETASEAVKDKKKTIEEQASKGSASIENTKMKEPSQEKPEAAKIQVNKAGYENKAQKKDIIYRLIRKVNKDAEYYEVYGVSMGEKHTLKPEELRGFLEKIENRKIRFKYDYIEFTVPIHHRNLPVTFNVKENGESIVLTTQRQLPIPLSLFKDVYYFKNELYLPSKEQIESFVPIYEKLKTYGEIIFKKEINIYNKLMFILTSISNNLNISESLREFYYSVSEPEFFLYEETGRIYCDAYINYADRKINVLSEAKGKDSVIRDSIKEQKLFMEMEKNYFKKLDNRFVFYGGDGALFNILSKRGASLHALGKVVLGRGLTQRSVYDSSSIKADIYEDEGNYGFHYSIGDVERSELKQAFEAYRDKKRFYKTKRNGFIDFEDEGVRSFFKVFEVLNISEKIELGNTAVEKSKALYIYENMRNKGYGLVKNSKELEAIEKKLIDLAHTEIILPPDFKGELREYQLIGFKWLKTLSELGFGGILADEMGLGKTIQTIAFLLSEKNKKTLIVCPTSLIYNWKEELHKFAPSLRVMIVHGSERIETIERIKAAEGMNEFDVVLTTYGTLRVDIEKYSCMRFDYCIIDEGQNIKNATAQNTKVIKEIKASTRFALTGTPIENNLTELWSIFDFVMPGYLYTKEKFEEKFILRAEDNLESLKLLIKPFILRRTKKEVIKELPDKIEKKLLVEMTPAQKAVYSTYIKRVKELMKNNSDGKIEIFSYLTRLRQICLDPSLIIEDYEGGSGKLEVALELIRGHIDSGNKVLLFSQFASVLENIGEVLREENIGFFHLDGKTKPKDRLKRVKEFNNGDDIKVFLISLKAGGTGLNLTSANLVIHFDPWWNPAVEDQATDRAHRIGQSDVVEVIRLVSKRTIEEKILLLQEDKKELINNILTGELQNNSLLGSLSKEDLLQLFDRE